MRLRACKEDGLAHKRRKLVSPSPCLEGPSSDPEGKFGPSLSSQEFQCAKALLTLDGRATDKRS
ncbi:unnamed protein product [Ixodes pacificus]